MAMNEPQPYADTTFGDTQWVNNYWGDPYWVYTSVEPLYREFTRPPLVGDAPPETLEVSDE